MKSWVWLFQTFSAPEGAAEIQAGDFLSSLTGLVPFPAVSHG
jgi:hypothetical protein